jgi:cell shape-determining protein MreC
MVTPNIMEDIDMTKRTPKPRLKRVASADMTKAELVKMLEAEQEDNRSLRRRLNEALETSEMRRLHSEMWKAAADLWLHRLAATAAMRPGIGIDDDIPF